MKKPYRQRILDFILHPVFITLPLLLAFIGALLWIFGSSSKSLDNSRIYLKKGQYDVAYGTFGVTKGQVYVIKFFEYDITNEWVEFGVFITDKAGNLLNQTDDVIELWNEEGIDSEGKWRTGNYRGRVFFKATKTEKIKIGAYWIDSSASFSSISMDVDLHKAHHLLFGQYGKYLCWFSGAFFLVMMTLVIIFDKQD